jgi:hypothetical protein
VLTDRIARDQWNQTMAMTEKEWGALAEARSLDAGTGKRLEPERSSDSAVYGSSCWTDRDIVELHRVIRGLHNEFTVITRLIMVGIGAMVLLHFIH